MARVETPPIDYSALAADQLTKKDLNTLIEPGSALKLERVPIPAAEVAIYCDTSTKVAGPYIIRNFRKQAFFHRLSHPGARSTIKLVTQRFIWPELQLVLFVNSRSSRFTCTLHTSHFEHILIDIIKLPHAEGMGLCLMCVDRYTRRPEVCQRKTRKPKPSPAPFTRVVSAVSAHQCESQLTMGGNLNRAFSSH